MTAERSEDTDPRIETLRDQGIFNGTMARAALDGSYERQTATATSPPVSEGGYRSVAGPGSLVGSSEARQIYIQSGARQEVALLADTMVIKRLRELVASGDIKPVEARARWQTHLRRRRS